MEKGSNPPALVIENIGVHHDINQKNGTQNFSALVQICSTE
jgi:hypothetical protein